MTTTALRNHSFTIILLSLPLSSIAAPVEWKVDDGGNGHFYEVVVADGISWNAARIAAEEKLFEGRQGHLATLTSAAEDNFVDMLRDQTPGINNGDGENPFLDSELWVGGVQPAGVENPADGWEWINDEGPFGYTNWLEGEPNDAGGAESHLAIGLFNLDGWNDEGNLDGIWGYVVEWDGVVPAEECQDPEGCNPSGVQRVVLPPSVVLQDGDTLTQVLVEREPGAINYRDPRVDDLGQCFDRRELDVFLELGGGTPGTLILPRFLCGSPEFAIVSSTASFEVLRDVVRSEQFPEELFVNTFDCAGAPGDTDLQRRGVFAWQPDNPAEVIENRALELTNDCGSSRGATKGLSWFVLNLHIDCGIAFGTDDSGVESCLRLLTNQKFVGLGIAVFNAAPALTGPEFRQILGAYLRAYARFLFFRYDPSVSQLDEFLALVEGTVFGTGGNNDQGELLMRGENIRFIIDTKLDP